MQGAVGVGRSVVQREAAIWVGHLLGVWGLGFKSSGLGLRA